MTKGPKKLNLIPNEALNRSSAWETGFKRGRVVHHEHVISHGVQTDSRLNIKSGVWSSAKHQPAGSHKGVQDLTLILATSMNMKNNSFESC